jgi:hypothetical protein
MNRLKSCSIQVPIPEESSVVARRKKNEKAVQVSFWDFLVGFFRKMSEECIDSDQKKRQ